MLLTECLCPYLHAEALIPHVTVFVCSGQLALDEVMRVEPPLGD